MKKIRVLIVDDSLLIRKVLTSILNTASDIEVVGAAEDPLVARDMIKQFNPDVLTLDIEMPHMDGITFLRNLMRLRPMPVVMISTLTEHGAEATLDALALGAVDFVLKPRINAENTLADYSEEIISKVRVAANTNVKAIKQHEEPQQVVKVINPMQNIPLARNTAGFTKIIALGSSTGGTEAIKVVVKSMPADSPPILITQHLPAAFSDSFVKHIDSVTQMTASIPVHGQVVEWGNIYLAPGTHHMEVIRNNNQYIIQLQDSEPVNRHKPSVDVLFHAAAKCAKDNAVCVLLTGMGADGAVGMQAMKTAGAKTIVQDEASSVVWGMPGAAFKLGCADYVVPLDDIAAKILTLVKSGLR
ncbi:MAG: chemotaxis response regulator protein-glutamate methylesterase [Methylococcales bacterium]|nr:chemotaxis response regulator protein-glutamate methylesterase [Methylococcales bacterium]MDD5754267.1 chemotaxis response regulator protein-glutamate methylesterase [Methylococcales bacterium]